MIQDPETTMERHAHVATEGVARRELTSEQVEAGYDAIAERYTQAYDAPRFLYENDKIRRIVSRAVKRNHMSILDIGCGTGLGATLCPSFAEYIGIDLSSKMLRIAQRQHSDGQFVKGTAEDLPFDNGTFDVAIALFGVLSHIGNLGRSFHEVSRVLKPRGVFIGMAYSLAATSGPTHHHGTSVEMYRVRGIADSDNVDIPAKFYAPRELCKIASEVFERVRVRGLTTLFSDRDPRGNAAGAIQSIADSLITTVRPSGAHSLVVKAYRRRDHV